jgi:hypothetical protein
MRERVGVRVEKCPQTYDTNPGVFKKTYMGYRCRVIKTYFVPNADVMITKNVF